MKKILFYITTIILTIIATYFVTIYNLRIDSIVSDNKEINNVTITISGQDYYFN